MSSVREIVDLANINNMMGVSDQTINTKVSVEHTNKWDISLKREIINWGDYEIIINELNDNYIKNNFISLVSDGDYLKNIYYIQSNELSEKTYIYNKEYDIIFKIKKTGISKFTVHSIDELNYLQNGGERNKSKINYTKVSQNVEIKQVGTKKYYEPDLNNLAQEVTSLIFYKYKDGQVKNEEKPISVQDWIERGKPNQIIEGTNTYILYDYEKKIWANIRIKTSNIETNWTWIPRYAIANQDTTTNVAFIDIENKLLNGEQGEFTLLEAFKDNKQKGIWISKYELTTASTKNTSSYSYYIPDITGLDKENTYLEIYDEKAEKFVDEVQLSKITNLSKFANENNWFDYYKQRWANIKVVKNGIETWWVWIPRYAYNNTDTTNGGITDIVFIDTSNPSKQINGENLPSSYIVPEAFKGNNLKGMWVSKYELTEK